jgi:hypothetical protein
MADAFDRKRPELWIPRDLFAEYCGEDSPELLVFYDKATRQKDMLTMSFDLLAVLALPAWLGYRRQWKIWATFTGLIAAVTVIEQLARFSIPSGAFVGTGVVLGLMARGFLLTDATGAWLKLKREGRDSAAIQQALRGRARKSVALAFAGGIGAVLILLAIGMLAELIHPN